MKKLFDTDSNYNRYYLSVARYACNDRLYIGIIDQIDDLISDITVNLTDVKIKSNNQIFLSGDVLDEIKFKLIEKGIISEISDTQKYNMGEYQIAYVNLDILKEYDSSGVEEFLNSQEKENDSLFDFYDEDEIRKLLDNKERLVYIDNGVDEVVARYEDLPDIIVDVNEKFNHTENLKVYDFDNPMLDNPLLTTIGSFLDKCDSQVRNDIIERLTELQTGKQEVKSYKFIDEDMLDDIINDFEMEN